MSVKVLPRALAPWAKQLDLFAGPAALSIAPLLPRLSGVLGGGGPVIGSRGEPDGFDGIDRRGPYERLLPSEWLLLSEAPEEFLRRVAMSEHAFLRLSHRSRPVGRDVVALLDAGPDQLGSPRIAHLAALIVLAARAEREKGTFAFGVLQSQPPTLHVGLSIASLTAMLESASPRPASKEMIARYLAEPQVQNARERWLVGAEDLRPASLRGSTSALRVTEPVEIDARRLDVTAIPAGPPRERRAVLELPPEQACVRLLRDPFESSAPVPVPAPKVGIDVAAGLVLSDTGRRVHLRGARGELVTIGIPTSPLMASPPPSVYKPPFDLPVIAVGHDPEAGRAVVVCPGEKRYFFYQLVKNCRRGSGLHREHPLVPGTPFPTNPLPSKLGRIWFPKSHGLCFHDAEGRPIQLYMGPAARPAFGDDAQPPWEWRGPTPEPPRIPEGASVEAVIRDIVTGEVTHAVILDPSRTRLELYRDGRGELLTRTSSPIRHVEVSEAHRLVAYLTDSGHLGVYSWLSGAMLVSVAAAERLEKETHPRRVTGAPMGDESSPAAPRDSLSHEDDGSISEEEAS
ncbi:MAG: hypothetical protein U0441_14360 [Polyangiaceae bacterium]